MIICVVGPTAVGKTKLSEKLAKKYNAIVVNSDATQIYRELNIGTAKIKDCEKETDEHYLFDIKNPDEFYSVYDYQKDLRKILDNNAKRNIVIVGGTGLYLKAGLYDYEFNDFPEKNEYENISNEELYENLVQRGLADGIHVNNRRRLISRMNSPIVSNKKDKLLYSNVVIIGLTTSRENLYERINRRVDEMMQEGLLEEVRYLYKKYGSVKSLKTAIGYKELIEFLEGQKKLEDSIELIKKRSRNYAKRQFTWFNHQMNVQWFETNYSDFNATIEEVVNYIEKR